MNITNFYLITFIKDFKIALSYRMQFMFSFISIFVSMFFIVIFSGLVDGSNNPVMDKYGGSYFVFLFFGFITAEMTMLFLNTMPFKIREYQLTGIFEELMMSGRKEFQIILSTLLYPCFFQLIRFSLYFVLFSILEPQNNFLSNLSNFSYLAIILFSTSLIGISLISSAFTILYKSKGVINTLYLSTSSILSGVAFPVDLLPNFLIFLGEFIPTTQFLKLVRADLADTLIQQDAILGLALLSVMAFVLIYLGIYLLNKSLLLSKQNGTLLTY